MEAQSRSITQLTTRNGGVEAPRSDSSRQIKILIDARKLGHGGIGVYTENLIHGLLARKSIKLGVIVGPGAKNGRKFPSATQIFETKIKPFSLLEQLGLGREIPFADFDLFHTPNYPLPAGIKIPTIVTIHDLIHIHYPESWYHPLIAAPLIRSSMRRASAVLTVSQASAGALKSFAPEFAHKVGVISNSLAPDFLEEKAEQVELGDLGVKTPFLLSVLSNSKPHKGIPDLLGAFARLRETAPDFSQYKLVLVGQGISKQKAEDAVIRLGEVDRSTLSALYRSASAIVIPSLVEGFCLQALEARALGVPIITRPVPAVLELVGSSDTVCPDFSVAGLLEGMRRGLSSKAERDNVIELSSVLERYSVQRQAEQIEAAYRDTISRVRVNE